ncbi:hypothetical protein RRG08_033346 [Elysia crispata]|uniref:Uncharacterized protein n=1 Tax=Elysia crispata TaxID=231223 RepID=A0AAE1DB71_9GAST|nr:hypothetical protein RRG08_033346 [Elysia crispata]
MSAAGNTEGQGIVTCYNSEGQGIVTCYNSEGQGIVTCYNSEGQGIVTCYNSEGQGIVTCYNSEGQGIVTCYNSEGQGICFSQDQRVSQLLEVLLQKLNPIQTKVTRTTLSRRPLRASERFMPVTRQATLFISASRYVLRGSNENNSNKGSTKTVWVKLASGKIIDCFN